MSNRRRGPLMVAPLSGGTFGSAGVAAAIFGVAVAAGASVERATSNRPGSDSGLLGGLTAVAVMVALIAAGVVVRAITRRWRDRTNGQGRRGAGAMVVRRTGRVLPFKDREVYVEEWQAWLSDLRESGEPWYRRLGELLSIVFVAAPRLAVILRLGGRKAVD